MRLLEELTQGDVASLPFDRTIGILPFSPLERHGPHLPIGTDLILSSAMARSLAEKIEERWPGVEVIIAPLVPIGAEAVPGPGSVRTRQSTLHELAFDLVSSLARTGFQNLLFCSVHGSIGHFVALEEVAERAISELNIRVDGALSGIIVPFLRGRYLKEIESRLGRPFTAEERHRMASDVHGGQWETSALLALRPDLVGDYASQAPVLFQGWLQLRNCMRASCDNGLGYVGAPADSTVEYYHAASAVMVENVLEQIDKMLHAPRFRPFHTPFYYWPPYRTRETPGMVRADRGIARGMLLGALLGLAGRWILKGTRKTESQAGVLGDAEPGPAANDVERGIGKVEPRAGDREL